MRIGIDARFYHLGLAGLGRYTQELIAYLAKNGSEHTFVIFMRPEDAAAFPLAGTPGFEVQTTTIGHYTVREQLAFGRVLNRAALDLMHFTNFNFPLSYRRPFIISINDLTLLRYAGRSRFSRLKVPAMRVVMQAGARRSRQVLTYSEYQKKLITKEFGIPPAKIDVVYLAVDEQFRPLPAAEVTAFRKRVGLEKPFVMYAGQWRQHKNLVRLLKAFRVVRQQMDATLVFVGKVDPAFPIIQRTITEQKLENDVVLTGFVDDADLPLYYNAAAVFAFPSLSEGFGLPPLEAMACGTPVVASSAPPMPEILGQAARYFDPQSVDDLASTLLDRLRKPPSAAERQAGFAQVRQYSWEQTAAQTLAAYEAALGDSP
jgi:glycosyltransferase involved in cell wall biosynthesis